MAPPSPHNSWLTSLINFSSGYTSLDASRPWLRSFFFLQTECERKHFADRLVYWILHSLEILGALKQFPLERLEASVSCFPRIDVGILFFFKPLGVFRFWRSVSVPPAGLVEVYPNFASCKMCLGNTIGLGPGQVAHLAPTYAACMALSILGGCII